MQLYVKVTNVTTIYTVLLLIKLYGKTVVSVLRYALIDRKIMYTHILNGHSMIS